MERQPVNPYQPPAPSVSDVVHHFTWRSAGTTLLVGTHERHEVTVHLDFLTVKTIVQVDGQVVRAFRYFFDPPPIRLDVGQAERHEVEIDLIARILRASHIKLDGQVVVPQIMPGLLWLSRLGTVLMPFVASAVFVTSYFMWRDWIQDLLVQLIAALTLILLAFVVFVECLGWVRMNRDPASPSKTSAHAPSRSPNAR